MTAFPSLSAAGERRQARLADARVLVVTDARREQGDLEAFLTALCDASADVLLLRDKTATEDELRRAADVFRRVCDRGGALFILNDLPGLATQVGADGVHVGQRDVHPDHARRVCGPDLLIGRTCHRPEELEAAGDEDVDYLDVGPVFGEPGGPSVPGPELVRYASRHATCPWFAFGGIDASCAEEVVAAGAGRLAVGRGVTHAADASAAVWALRRAVGHAH